MAKNAKTKQKGYDEKRQGTRVRNWTIIFYPEDLPENWLEKVIDLRVKFILSPLHDKDLNADGEPKKPHYHSLFMFENLKTEQQVIKMFKELFGESESGSIIGVPEPKKVTDRGSMVRYFCHLDNPDKVQYDVSELQGYNGADVLDVLKRSASEQQNYMREMQSFIIENNITELWVFAEAIKNNTEWYRILTTQSTVFFTNFIRSRRCDLKNQADEKKLKEIAEKLNSVGSSEPTQQAEPESEEDVFIYADQETGEVLCEMKDGDELPF